MIRSRQTQTRPPIVRMSEAVLYSTWQCRKGMPVAPLDFFACHQWEVGQGFMDAPLGVANTNLREAARVPDAFTVRAVTLEVLDAPLSAVWPYLSRAALTWQFLTTWLDISPVSLMFQRNNPQALFMYICTVAYDNGDDAVRTELEGAVLEALIAWDRQSEELWARLTAVLTGANIRTDAVSVGAMGAHVYRGIPILIPANTNFAVRLDAPVSLPVDCRLRISIHGETQYQG